MRKLIAGIALTTAVTAVTTTAASAAPAAETTRHQSLHAWTLLNDRGPGPTPPGERLTARVDARTTAGREARGHATIQHVFPGGSTVRVEMSIDCLTTNGAAVTVTGPIDSLHFTVPAGQTQPDPAPSTWHPETALTFYPADEHGEHQVGWAGANALDYSAPAKATKCTPTEPNTWIIQGGFTLRR
ncbi:hypothetical protein [Kitasatospora sp. NPDC050543]|uniref:hypothetical protein n=1 Tax=Kitasatospora sp. NPDC050543 TaxID=3364054 RepID=UPI00379F4B68